jgi:hypothetical protein
MTENLSNIQSFVSEKNLDVRNKICLLCDNDFVWKEIAVLSRLPKKLVKGIAKKKYILSEEECIRFGKHLDEAIAKVNIMA